METGDEGAGERGGGGCCPTKEQCASPQWVLIWRAINGVMFTFFILCALVNVRSVVNENLAVNRYRSNYDVLTFMNE